MRRIFLFLISNRVFLLFISLQLIAFFFIVQFQQYQNARFLHSANAVSASIHGVQKGLKEYLDLKETNEALVIQNAILLNNKRDSAAQVKQIDSTMWMASLNLESFEVIPSKIVYNTVNRPNNTFVIDKGSKHGIEKGLGIASAKGIIGKVIRVNKNYSLCLSILNIKTPVVMPKILELENKSGRLEWGGRNPSQMQLRDIHKFEKLDSGYKVVSSSYSINFPENIPVGTITELTKKEESFYDIKVKLAADLSKEYYAFVFKNRNQQQIDSTINLENELN